jgi:hypothetical protein
MVSVPPRWGEPPDAVVDPADPAVVDALVLPPQADKRHAARSPAPTAQTVHLRAAYRRLNSIPTSSLVNRRVPKNGTPYASRSPSATKPPGVCQGDREEGAGAASATLRARGHMPYLVPYTNANA